MDQSHRFPDLPAAPRRDPFKEDGLPETPRLWGVIVDFLGGCKPLNLIVGACALIELIAIGIHLATGR